MSLPVVPESDRTKPFADHIRNHPPAPFLVVSPTVVPAWHGEGSCGMKIYCLLCKEDLCGVPERHRWISCLSSSGDWLMLLDDVSNLHMLNPVTGEVIPLPPLSSIKDDFEAIYAEDGSSIVSYHCRFRLKPMMSTAKEAGRSYFGKVITGHSSAANAPVVMAITQGRSRHLAFTRVDDHDMAWISVRPTAGHLGHYRDIMHLKGRFYALDSQGELRVFDFDGVHPRVTLISDDLSILGACDRYLAHSADGNTIYQILRPKDPMGRLKVYELHDNNRWMQPDGLVGYTLFLGGNQVISVKNRDFPTSRECSYYFTRSYSVPPYFCHEPDMGHKPIPEVEFQNFDIAYPEKYQRTWPYPVWYMPDCFPPRGRRVETRSMSKKRGTKGTEEEGTTTKKRGNKRAR